MGHNHRIIAAVLSGVAMLSLLGQDKPAVAERQLAPSATGDLLYHESTFYPRLARLEHSGAANGRIVASVTGRTRAGHEAGLIFESDDDGQRFQRIAEVPDVAATAGTGVCCGSLYELPVAVGDMPAGTLLRAASVGTLAHPDKRQARIRLWRSVDHGYTWNYVSDIAVARNRQGLWEPELMVIADGRLAVFYSDETDYTNHDQKLVKTASSDGRHWSPPESLILRRDRSARPGMAVVRPLPGGRFFMAYEICDNDGEQRCEIYTRHSRDGWDWGDPYAPATPVRTVDGNRARHTPTIAWSPSPGANGRILLISATLVNADGRPVPVSGETVLGNDNLGAGRWIEMPAPVRVSGPSDSVCRNYSPSLLPSKDGQTVLEMSTDYVAKNDCRAYFATGPIDGPR